MKSKRHYCFCISTVRKIDIHGHCSCRYLSVFVGDRTAASKEPVRQHEQHAARSRGGGSDAQAGLESLFASWSHSRGRCKQPAGTRIHVCCTSTICNEASTKPSLTSSYPPNQDELLKNEIARLKSRLSQQERMLSGAVKRLRTTNQLKEGMERVIIDQRTFLLFHVGRHCTVNE